MSLRATTPSFQFVKTGGAANMPSKKSASKKPQKAKSSGSRKIPFPLALPEGAEKRSRSKKASKRGGVKLVRLWGGGVSQGSSGFASRKIKVMPNPWPPDDIVRAITVACSAYGGMKLASMVFETIKLWLDARKARKVRIKKGDVEIEIQAGMTAKEIEKTIDLLVRKTRELEDEKPEIILPPGVDRSIPPRPPVKQ
jgi:hypothetical protein